MAATELKRDYRSVSSLSKTTFRQRIQPNVSLLDQSTINESLHIKKLFATFWSIFRQFFYLILLIIFATKRCATDLTQNSAFCIETSII